MKRLIPTLMICALVGMSLGMPEQAHAADQRMELLEAVADSIIRVAAQGRFMSLDEAVSRVRRQVDGEVISAKTRYESGRPVHYIKVYDRGRVRTIRVDAASGRIR